MTLRDWLKAQGAIAHRQLAQQAGYSPYTVRTAAQRGEITRLGNRWICLEETDAAAKTAALAGGKITCISLARERGWFIPEGIDGRLHLHVPPHRHAPADATVHWAKPLAPTSDYSLRASVLDALQHIATCYSGDAARMLWESASRVEKLSVDALQRVRWTNNLARHLAHGIEGLSDSGLETIVFSRVRRWGVAVRQQVVLLGRPVDGVIGTHLVVQADGYEFHNGAQRTRDIAHDAELRLRGYTVLRFSYEQIMYRWHEVERILQQAIAQGLHLAPELRVA